MTAPNAFAESARYSRDGDQFHYLWAARRCLRLLAPADDLVAVTVEGPSKNEDAPADVAGEQLIDVAEYYGSEALAQARAVRYLQLKHSTVRSDQEWTPSEIARTIAGFAERFSRLRAEIPQDRLSFEFVSNRPVSDDLRTAAALLAAGGPPGADATAAKLAAYAKLQAADLKAFFERFSWSCEEPDFKAQKTLLQREARAFISSADQDAPTLLKDLVAEKATSLGAKDPAIRREDILFRWRVSQGDLFPAPSKLAPDPKAVPRRQEKTIAAAIAASTSPVLIHAAGGVGKSVLATRLGELLPVGSITVTYDCYGGGDYRQRGQSRHRHVEALVQVINELATLELCDPLVPVGRMEPGALLRAFSSRLADAAAAVHARSPKAVVCVVFDAVDNAQMAATEFEEGRAFAADLLLEPVPSGARIVMLCRPERRWMVAPPPHVLQIALEPFGEDETEAHLRTKFPKSRAADVAEFHRLSSRNPRVQANALAQGGALGEMLGSLGPNPTTVSAAIAGQLERALADIKHMEGHDVAAVDTLCAAMAVLRPLIPLEVLSQLSGLSVDAIRSFATDFAGGRPLMIVGDALQFRDEPVEDWFRQQYRPDQPAMKAFVALLKPAADTSVYVAINLPALMLDAGEFDELVAMALASVRLPTKQPSQMRDIEVQRLSFALRAAIRLRKWPAAVKLALRAGEEQAGDAREQKFLQDQYDLTARFFDPATLQALVARRTFSGKWQGARYVYEAAVLSASPSLIMDARTRLRMAHDWIRAWSRASRAEKDKGSLQLDDAVAAVFAELGVHGPEAALKYVTTWQPTSVWPVLTERLFRKLIDHGRWADLDAMSAIATEGKLASVLASLVSELSTLARVPSPEAVTCILEAGLGKRTTPKQPNEFGYDRSLTTVTAIVEAAVLHGLRSPAELVASLKRRFPGKPDRSIGSRYGGSRGDHIRLHALIAALEGRKLSLIDIAPPDVRASMETPTIGTFSQSRTTLCISASTCRSGLLIPFEMLRSVDG